MSRAGSYLYEFWNDADHVAKLAKIAMHAEDNGHSDEALESLREAVRPAGLLELRLKDSIRMVSESLHTTEPTKHGRCESPDGPCGYAGRLAFREACLLWLCPDHFSERCKGDCAMECKP